MSTPSIYGEYAQYLPKILQEITDPIIAANIISKKETGFKLYEHFISRIKESDSMREKCRRKNLPETSQSALKEIRDSIGIRIVCGFVDDIYKTIDVIKAIPGVSIYNEKDYILNAKPNGYRSYHLILEVETEFPDVLGNERGTYFVEVQLRTIAQDSWASLEHQMKFLVCIKQVVDTSKMEVDPETGRLKRNNANGIMNPVDLNALEAALSLRDRIGGTVTVITMGPPQAEAVLRDAVAMGADDIYLVTDRAFGGADTLATSYTLAAAISKIGMPDLIFCGIESIDSNTAQIGPEIAATLGIADVSGASFISFEKEGGLIVTRQNGSSAEVVELKLPAVVTVLPELNKPRYSSIKGILGKGDAELHIITAADLDIDTARIGIKGSPTQVKRVRPIVPPQKENLRIEEKDPQESVDILIEALRKISVI